MPALTLTPVNTPVSTLMEATTAAVTMVIFSVLMRENVNVSRGQFNYCATSLFCVVGIIKTDCDGNTSTIMT